MENEKGCVLNEIALNTWSFKNPGKAASNCPIKMEGKDLCTVFYKAGRDVFPYEEFATTCLGCPYKEYKPIVCAIFDGIEVDYENSGCTDKSIIAKMTMTLIKYARKKGFIDAKRK